ncbi:MAG: hypothetical protein H0X28_03735 [Solirubrobacterales bacterium]|nr:hypothetical protein [Solirubrobacterales bacterium]
MFARTHIALIAALVALTVLPAAAQGASADVASTNTFVQANYVLVRSARAHLAAAEAAPRQVLAQVRRECPHAAAESPQNGDSTQLSNEVIGAMVLRAYQLDAPALHSFVAAASALHWSSAALTRTVRGYAADLRVLAQLAPPHLCADVRAWVASGYRTLPAATVAFDRVFMPAWVGIGLHPAGLTRFAGAQQRSLLKRSDGLVVQLADGEARAVERWGDIMNELGISP